jgi:hypothetical protein
MNKAFIFLLGFTAGTVAIVGAAFSISGLTKMAFGAPLLVMIVAGLFEFAKMFSASFLHANWKLMHPIMRFYLSAAVGILMSVTGLGIFNCLSFAYQSAAADLKDSMVRLENMESDDRKIQEEYSRLQGEIDHIPGSNEIKKLEKLKELDSLMDELKNQSAELRLKIRGESIRKLSLQIELGPAVRVAQLFNTNMDDAATYLIVLFVFIFDPLAVCLVVAATFAIKNSDKLFTPEPISADARPAA